MDQQRVLITGGAGFLGINLARHLLSRGYAVASLDVEDFDYPERDRVEVIRGDIRNKAVVDRAIEGADFVVHTAAALPLYSPGRHLHHRRGGDAQRARRLPAPPRRAFRPRLLDGGVRDPGPPSVVRDRQAGGRRALRAGQDPGRDDLPGVPREGAYRSDHPPKSFIGPERLGVFALLYDWAHTGHNFP